MSAYLSELLVSIRTGVTSTIIYTKPNGIVNIRAIRPYAIERCANGNTVLRAVCVHQDEPRSFTLDSISAAITGNVVKAPSNIPVK